MLVSLMNPENRKMAQLSFNPATSNAAGAAYGWNKLNFSSLGTKALTALTKCLGKDPRTFTDLLVSTRAIANATASTPAAAVARIADLNITADEFNGFTQETE